MAPKKLSIAIDTTFMDRRRAKGTAIWIHEIVAELRNYRDEFDITLIHREKIPEEPLYHDFKEIVIPRLRLPKFSGFFSELLFFVTTKERFDIYYFAYSRLYPSFWLVPARKIVYAAMDGGPLTAGYTAYGTNPKVSFLTRLFMRKIDIFVALTEFGRKGIQESYGVGPEKVRVVYCGLTDDFKPLPEKDTLRRELRETYGIESPFILDVSRFDPHKNIINLIHAYKKFLDDTHSGQRLVFVGGRHMPDYSDEVERLIHELGLSTRVFIAPYIETEDLPKVYNAADFFVFPSLYEGFGMPAAEAMACGTPVLVSNIAALTEVTNGAAEVVDPQSVDSIARGMTHMLDAAYRQELSRKGIVQAATFTWSKSGESIADIFRSIAT
ncbi:MAG TPA: glycosyltransferase family 1 protein [Candidatus Paceibacterota bacterium]|nr:glycosyltransferase family 1 protein [Candidatus Paceibacterota bacterium]